MTIVKGQRLNPNGRPKGSKNIATLEKEGLIKYLKEKGADKFIRELDKLEGKEFCQTYIPVVELAFPKKQRIDQTITGNLNVRTGILILPKEEIPNADSMEAT